MKSVLFVLLAICACLQATQEPPSPLVQVDLEKFQKDSHSAESHADWDDVRKVLALANTEYELACAEINKSGLLGWVLLHIFSPNWKENLRHEITVNHLSAATASLEYPEIAALKPAMIGKKLSHTLS